MRVPAFIRKWLSVFWSWVTHRTNLWLAVSTILYTAVVTAVLHRASETIGFFDNSTMRIESWEDRRSFGLGFAGLLAPWLALVGYILSAARTKAMEDANQETKNKRLHERYENALKDIDGEGLSAIGAIETIKAVALQDQSLLAQTINILCSYLNRNAKIDDPFTNTCAKHNQLHLHFQHALIALVELQQRRLRTSRLSSNNHITRLTACTDHGSERNRRDLFWRM